MVQRMGHKHIVRADVTPLRTFRPSVCVTSKKYLRGYVHIANLTCHKRTSDATFVRNSHETHSANGARLSLGWPCNAPIRAASLEDACVVAGCVFTMRSAMHQCCVFDGGVNKGPA